MSFVRSYQCYLIDGAALAEAGVKLFFPAEQT